MLTLNNNIAIDQNICKHSFKCLWPFSFLVIFADYMYIYSFLYFWYLFRMLVFFQNDAGWLRLLVQRHLILFISAVAILVTRWRVMGSAPPTFQVVDNPHSFVNGTILRVSYCWDIFTCQLYSLFLHTFICDGGKHNFSNIFTIDFLFRNVFYNF